MESYTYKALNNAGEHTRGALLAADRQDALQRLRVRGWHVLEIGRGDEASAPPAAGGWLRRRRLGLTEFTRQLATLQRSGVPLARSINVLIEQNDDPDAQELLSDILEAVKAGQSLSDALARHREVFPQVMISMVRTGEVSGTLDEVLTRLADLFEKQEQIRSEVRAALAYPLLVLLLGIGSAFVLITFVIPRLRLMFDAVGESLPLPTRVLLGISGVFRAAWWAIGLVVVALCVAGYFARRSERVQAAWDRFKLRIPWASTLVRNAAIARFARALGTMVHADVSIVEALKVAQAAVGNRAIAAEIGRMARDVQSGDSLAKLMTESGAFSPLTVQMVAVGEETGHLDEMLLHVADAYDRQAAASARMLTSLLAPVLILIVAALVAFLILSLVLPIFKLSAGIG